MSNIGAHNYLQIVPAAAPAPAYHLRRIGRASPLIQGGIVREKLLISLRTTQVALFVLA